MSKNKNRMGLNEVNAEIERLVQVRRKLQDDNYNKNTLPRMRAMVGKTFRYENSYGFGKPWPLWVRITGIGDGCLAIFKAERDCYGQISVKTDTAACELDAGYVEVTHEEYGRAVSEIMTQLQLLADV